MSLYCFPADDVPAGVEVPAKPVTSLRRSAGTELLCGLALLLFLSSALSAIGRWWSGA